MEQKRPLLSIKTGVIFLLPALFFVSIFLIFPFIWIILVSFTNETLTGIGALSPHNVGLENYTSLFNFSNWMMRGKFGNSLVITLQFVFGSAMIGQLGLGLALAIAFYRKKGFLREFVNTLVILAWIIPDVVVAFSWVAFLDRDFGTLNLILKHLRSRTP